MAPLRSIQQIILSVLTVLLFCLPAVAGDSGMIRIGIPQDHPGGGNHTTGQCPLVGLLNYVARQEGWRISLIETGHDDILKKMAAAEIDLYAAAPFDGDNGSDLIFSRHSFISSWAQVYTFQGAELHSLLDLQGKNIGVLEDSPYNQKLQEMLKGLNVSFRGIEFKTYDHILEALEKKWIQAGLMDRLYAISHQANRRIVETPILFSPIEFRFACRAPGDKRLIEAIDYHLNLLKNDPDSIYNRSMDDLFRKSADNRQVQHLTWGLIAMAIVLALLAANALFLRHQIKAKTIELAHKNKALEDELAHSAKTEATLRRSESKHRAVVENAHDIILVAQDGYLRFANPSAHKILGYPYETMKQMPFLELVHPEDREIVNQRYLKRLSGSPVPKSYSFRAVNKDGEILHLDINAIRIIWEQKPAVLCFLRDVTQAIKLENQLAQSQKMQAIGTLAGGIAHDFNNILSAILGYTEISLLDAEKGSKLEEHLNNILAAGQRAKELVYQILTFSRQHSKNKEPVQIRHIVKETLKLLRASLPTTIEFKESIDETTGAVMANPTQIHQVIMNLCTNAAHAMEAKGGTLTVSITHHDIDKESDTAQIGLTPGPHLCLTITDTGQGISQQIQDRIFEPYFTTKKQGRGTGLGLSVVHGIVKDIGGIVKIYSEEGKGTSAKVYLPIIAAHDQKPHRPQPAAIMGSGTILVVDDEPMLIEITSEMLSTLGYTAEAFSSSAKAYQALANAPQQYDLILTDYTMPEMTGLELAEKALRLRPDIPIVLCSGFSAGLTRQKTRELGITALMNKPILKQDLALTLHNALKHRRCN